MSCLVINPFVLNSPFLYPLKTSGNLTVFWCFQGGRERVHWEQMGYLMTALSLTHFRAHFPFLYPTIVWRPKLEVVNKRLLYQVVKIPGLLSSHVANIRVSTAISNDMDIPDGPEYHLLLQMTSQWGSIKNYF